MVDGEEIQRGAKMDPFSKHHHSKQYEFKSHCICDLFATGTRLERRLARPLLFLCFLTRGGAVSSFPLCDISRLASAFLVLSSRKSMTFFKTFQFTAEGYQAAKRSVWLIWRNYCWINQTAGPFTLIFSHFYLAEQRQTCRAGLLFVICVLKGARACAFSTCEVQRCTVLKTVASSTGCLLLHRLYADEERGDYLQRLFGLNLKKMCLSSCFAAPWWWKKEEKQSILDFPSNIWKTSASLSETSQVTYLKLDDFCVQLFHSQLAVGTPCFKTVSFSWSMSSSSFSESTFVLLPSSGCRGHTAPCRPYLMSFSETLW